MYRKIPKHLLLSKESGDSLNLYRTVKNRADPSTALANSTSLSRCSFRLWLAKTDAEAQTVALIMFLMFTSLSGATDILTPRVKYECAWTRPEVTVTGIASMVSTIQWTMVWALRDLQSPIPLVTKSLLSHPLYSWICLKYNLMAQMGSSFLLSSKLGLKMFSNRCPDLSCFLRLLGTNVMPVGLRLNLMCGVIYHLA